jgi:hypothetical protein
MEMMTNDQLNIYVTQLQAADKLAYHVEHVLLEFQCGITTVESYKLLTKALVEYHSLTK